MEDLNEVAKDAAIDLGSEAGCELDLNIPIGLNSGPGLNDSAPRSPGSPSKSTIHKDRICSHSSSPHSDKHYDSLQPEFFHAPDQTMANPSSKPVPLQSNSRKKFAGPSMAGCCINTVCCFSCPNQKSQK